MEQSNITHEALSKFNNFINNELNTNQKEVVLKKSGVLSVCAGAGSGKTRVITARITNLILNESCDPATIVALTFTNKAAREMRERVAHFLPKTIVPPYIGTFHSYCLQLLKKNSHLLDIANFTILDEDDKKKLIQKIINDHGAQKKVTATNVTYAISKLKNCALEGIVNVQHISDRFMQQLFLLYEQEKKRAHCFDFDDLLLETLKLFKKNSIFTKNYQNHVRHILVDEYQDTNQVQHALLKIITQDHNNAFTLDSLCIVGDEDQSIYSWRGATVSNIVNFKNDFPLTIPITIEQNYRSVQPILEAANSIINNNKERNPKKLWSNQPGHDRIRIVQTASDYQEGDIVVALTKKIFAQKNIQHCALLYRSHHQSRSIEEVLIRNSIPYKIIGGIQFYERQEIKDLLAYLKLTTNPFDRISFMRIYNIPLRGLGAKFEELFLEQWQQEPLLAFNELAQKLIINKALTKDKALELEKFIAIFTGYDGDSPAQKTVGHIITSINYFNYLKNAFDAEEAQMKSDNVKELINAVQMMETRGISTISDFLEEVALLQEHIIYKESTQNYLSLMTLHGAKGLEFDTIILTGLEEGLFPSSRSTFNPESLEEERRLLYVGITRSRQRILITHARNRYTYGQMHEQVPSRFLSEIPTHLAQRDSALYWKTPQIEAYIDQWLTENSSPQQQSFTRPQKIYEPAIKSLDTFNWDRSAFHDNHTGTALSESQSVKKTVWKLYQTVQHKKFGTGIIEKIEEKNPDTTHLTIRFSSGSKKIDAQFLSKI